tara:strand:+ start:692 stop:1552 length:861 start_codon:yes stop_codon:yes gene_type:complete
MERTIIINETQSNMLQVSLGEQKIDHNIIRAYAFDWDDNIMSMPTTIKMLQNVDGEWTSVEVPTDKFAHVRNDENYKLDDDAFVNFRDDESFLTDLKVAIENESFAPSFDKFKESLLYANPISIITARGHTPQALRNGMNYVVANTFTENEIMLMLDNIIERYPETSGKIPTEVLDFYLDSHEYHPVSSEEFAERFGTEYGSALNPEENKKIAFRDYVNRVLLSTHKMVDGGYAGMSIGFSDDDLGNVEAMESFIEEELRYEFPEVTFIIYDTSDGDNKKIVIKKA